MAQYTAVSNELWQTERKIMKLVNHKLDNLPNNSVKSMRIISLCLDFISDCWETADVYYGLTDINHAKKMLNIMKNHLRKLS